MPAYTSRKSLGTLPVVRQPLASITGSASYAGTYGWSAFRARMGTCTNTTFTETIASITDNQTINLLLFTTDVTAIGLVLDAGNATSILIAGLVSPATSVPFFDVTSGGADLSVLTGEVGSGYVGSVETKGFPAKAVNVVNGTSTKVDIAIIANGAQIQSPVSLLNWDSATTASGYLPVLIPASSYTTVIRDAGNQIITAGGVVYQVVGLYSVV